MDPCGDPAQSLSHKRKSAWIWSEKEVSEVLKISSHKICHTSHWGTHLLNRQLNGPTSFAVLVSDVLPTMQMKRSRKACCKPVSPCNSEISDSTTVFRHEQSNQQNQVGEGLVLLNPSHKL